jgi:hypothetical protein
MRLLIRKVPEYDVMMMMKGTKADVLLVLQDEDDTEEI